MWQAAFDGAACRYHRLPNHLPAEHPLPACFRAVAAEQVHLERFEIEDRNQVNQAFGHCGAFDRMLCHFRVSADARPGMTTSALFRGPVSPSYSHVARIVYDLCG